MPVKPLGRRAYGSIPHLIGSRRGPSDCGVNEGQQRICTEKCRKGDRIIVQEKLDGSNVAVAKINGEIVALTRAGYRASDSFYGQHRRFANWVESHPYEFENLLQEGWRVSGEWLALAHGTIYDLRGRQAFVAFDIFDDKNQRLTHSDFQDRILWKSCGRIGTPPCLFDGVDPVPLQTALKALGDFGLYGAREPAEGVVYRVEREGRVDFLAKYVRLEKVDGKYLDQERWLV